MSSRYSRRRIIVNNNPRNERAVENRNKKRIQQYDTYLYKIIEPEVLATIEKRPHRWVASDKYFKLAQTYYDNPKLWWVIAIFNQRPTENHCKPGDLIYIPTPIERVLSALEAY